MNLGVLTGLAHITHPYYAAPLAVLMAGTVALAVSIAWPWRAEPRAARLLLVMSAATVLWSMWIWADAVGTWGWWIPATAFVLGAVAAVRFWRRAGAAAGLGMLIASLVCALAVSVTVMRPHQGLSPRIGPHSAPVAPTAVEFGPTELTRLLETSPARWSAAVIGDHAAEYYLLATDTAVMPIGGWGGHDPSPTLAQFQELVERGQIGWFIDTDLGSDGTAYGADAQAIQAWVRARFPASSVDGVAVYRLKS